MVGALSDRGIKVRLVAADQPSPRDVIDTSDAARTSR
jgi:hypothetical protein